MRETRPLKGSGVKPQRPRQRETFGLYFKFKFYCKLNEHSWQEILFCRRFSTEQVKNRVV